MIKLTVIDDGVKNSSEYKDSRLVQSIDGYSMVAENIDSYRGKNDQVLVFSLKVGKEQANELITQIKEKQTKICLFISTDGKDYTKSESLYSIVRWLLLKSNLIAPSIKELTLIMNEDKPFNTKNASELLQQITDKPVLKSEFATKLTSREMEIMRYLSQGLLYKEIAKTMGISIQTVKSHLKHIYSKLQACNRTEAILRFFQTV